MHRQGLHLFQGFQFGKVPCSRGCIAKLYTFFNSRDPQNLPLFEKFACSGQIIKKLKIARLEDSESKQKTQKFKERRWDNFRFFNPGYPISLPPEGFIDYWDTIVIRTLELLILAHVINLN